MPRASVICGAVILLPHNGEPELMNRGPAADAVDNHPDDEERNTLVDAVLDASPEKFLGVVRRILLEPLERFCPEDFQQLWIGDGVLDTASHSISNGVKHRFDNISLGFVARIVLIHCVVLVVKPTSTSLRHKTRHPAYSNCL